MASTPGIHVESFDREMTNNIQGHQMAVFATANIPYPVDHQCQSLHVVAFLKQEWKLARSDNVCTKWHDDRPNLDLKVQSAHTD